MILFIIIIALAVTLGFISGYSLDEQDGQSITRNELFEREGYYSVKIVHSHSETGSFTSYWESPEAETDRREQEYKKRASEVWARN